MSKIKLFRPTNGQSIQLQGNSAGVLCNGNLGEAEVGDFGWEFGRWLG